MWDCLEENVCSHGCFDEVISFHGSVGHVSFFFFFSLSWSMNCNKGMGLDELFCFV